MSALKNNVADALDPHGKLQAARLFVLNRAPYHANVLHRLVPVQTDLTVNGVPTFAVTKHGRLLWNPKAIERWWKADGPDACGGVLMHEGFHFLLNHAARAEAVGANTPELRMRWNEAADLSINTMLKAGGWKLPKGALMPDMFGFAEGLTAEAYFALLSARPKPPPSKGAQQGAGAPQQGQQGQGPTNSAGNTPGVGAGACGGCAGNPGPGEPADDGQGAHDVSQVEADSIRRAVAQAVAAAVGAGRGTLPGELEVLLGTLKPPRVTWEQHLQRAVRNSLSARRGASDYTRTRFSRRQWGVGVGPGKPLLPAMHAPTPQVVFATDTSGSVSDDNLLRAASEVEGLCRALSAPLEFIAADTRISSRGVIRSAADLKGLMTGRGGTDFRPVFAQLVKEGFTGLVVYATDGDGPAPPAAPRGMSVVWLLFGKTARVPATWGTVVRVED